MLLKEDFRKLLIVCLKMLFRKSTRKRFVCLVIAFLFMMGFNTRSYVKKFHTAETLKKQVLDEKAFKVFYLRMRTRNNFARFFNQHYNALRQFGAAMIKKAFIYQNNLFIHFLAPSAGKDHQQDQGQKAMELLYSLFNIEKFAADFYVDAGSDGHQISVRDNYVDHNGAGLSKDIIAARHATLKFDLIDIADMIREKIWDKRTDVYNAIKKIIITNIKRISPDAAYAPNPYLSRVELIVPMNYLHILTNIKYDNTTDVVDLAESVSYQDDGTLKTDKAYLAVPETYKDAVMYQDIDAYPRYIPLYIPDVMRSQWSWLLFQNIAIKTDFMDYIDRLHFQGHYLFSYEKSHILKDKVTTINNDIRSNHIQFYLTDLSMGIAFPFMMSLFAFIHLKTEIAFLLMFKNKIRELLFIFWLLPVFLMLFVKGGILASYWLYLWWGGLEVTYYIILPLSITFILAAAVFYPINKWCFSPFTGDNLNLHALHKGR